MADVHVLGIRHHGPGSARSVIEALEQLRPAAILIEGPPELDELIELAGDQALVPPVAALVYDQQSPQQASFYPMAEFSPEWVALRWALRHGVRVRFIDLAAKHSFAHEESLAAEADNDQPGDESEGGLDDTVQEPSEQATAEPTDPIAELAAAAGYDDPERWWEDAIEQRHSTPLERFAALNEAISLIRERDLESSANESEAVGRRRASNELREAAMRRELRAELKGATGSVVVVCGAWHAPALYPLPPAAPDNRLLSGLPKVKVAAAWVPWAANRLSYASGYGAGVRAPGWYRHLFQHWVSGSSADVATTWLVRVAQALRSEGLDASTASVVDAARVATTLAAVRGRPTPGLSELNDAALGILVDGNPAPLALIHDRIVVGQELGSVPEGAPLVPLAADLAQLQKKYRLKPAALAKTVMLDLRTPAGLGKSVLLHRLRLLGVAWGTEADAGRTSGTFKEAWELVWTPELSIGLIEASLFGTTIASATQAKVEQVASTASTLGELSDLISRCLLAEVPIGVVVQRLEDRAAVGSDVGELLAAIEPLARTCRYGSVRGESVDQVRNVLSAVAVRGSVGLPVAASGADDDASRQLQRVIDSANTGLALIEDEDLLAQWQVALRTVAERDQIPGLLAGRAARLLLDAGQMTRPELTKLMSRWLSTAVDPAQAAGWLEGFLAGNAVLLIHDAQLLNLVDGWVRGVPSSTFDDVLPLLRRTFADFSPAERRSMGRLLVRGDDAEEPQAFAVDLAQAADGVAAVARLIGWGRAS